MVLQPSWPQPKVTIPNIYPPPPSPLIILYLSLIHAFLATVCCPLEYPLITYLSSFFYFKIFFMSYFIICSLFLSFQNPTLLYISLILSHHYFNATIQILTYRAFTTRHAMWNCPFPPLPSNLTPPFPTSFSPDACGVGMVGHNSCVFIVVRVIV